MRTESLTAKICRRMGLDPGTVSQLELTFLPNEQIAAKVHTWMKAGNLPEFELLEEYRLVRTDEVKILEDRIEALEEQLEESERNDARWRAIRPFLDVDRKYASAWTCSADMRTARAGGSGGSGGFSPPSRHVNPERFGFTGSRRLRNPPDPPDPPAPHPRGWATP